MKNGKRLKRVYLIGIGGIGMSALARYFNNEGVKVSGYDLVETPLTQKMIKEGIKIHYKEDPKSISKKVDLVIVTPAIPEDNKELRYCVKQGYEVKKRAEVLGMLSKGKRLIAIAGTHGKTTTSSILAHILESADEEVTAFLGGILTKEKTNFIHGKSETIIAEADEYDRSFLHLKPEVLVITSMDADHLDIYGSVEEMRKAYKQLTYQIKKGGVLILGPGVIRDIDLKWRAKLDKRKIKIIRQLKHFDFGKIKIENSKCTFDVTVGEMTLENIHTKLPGIHNIINTSIAILIAKLEGVSDKKIKSALKSFKGIKRRFETVYKGDRILIDDYAHHPEELKFAVKTVKDLYPGKKVLGIFQPHLYSRTQDFYKEFAKELEGLDAVLLMPIYPAREEPINGVKSELIFNLIAMNEKYLVNEKNLIKTLKGMLDYEVVMTIGAADLDKYHKKIIKVIKK